MENESKDVGRDILTESFRCYQEFLEKNAESFYFSLEDKIGSYNSQDSELIEETYYIPYGYMAEIRGNEVVIKKKPQFKYGDIVYYDAINPEYKGVYMLGNSNDLEIGYDINNNLFNLDLNRCTLASDCEKKKFIQDYYGI